MKKALAQDLRLMVALKLTIFKKLRQLVLIHLSPGQQFLILKNYKLTIDKMRKELALAK